jgi:hypothetical protein
VREQPLGDGKQGQRERRGGHPRRRALVGLRTLSRFLPPGLYLLTAACLVSGQTQPVNPATPLPNAPVPVIRHGNSKTGPCRVIPRSETAGKILTQTGAGFLTTVAGAPPTAAPPASSATSPAAVAPEDRGPQRQVSVAGVGDQASQQQVSVAGVGDLPACAPPPIINFFQRFMNGPEVKPLTPLEKARLAARNVLDPFNAVTILGNAAIEVGSNSHSPYGPGFHGFGQVVGVSYSEDMTGEFIGTFLIPSLAHQDPHYHRMPGATIKRRIFHAVAQVAWTQGDNGKGMLNYADLLGFPIDAEIANLYVPGEKTNLRSTAARVGIGWAIAPTDNFVTEFLPDLARRIHVRVVLVQEIINQVARTEPAGSP